MKNKTKTNSIIKHGIERNTQNIVALLTGVLFGLGMMISGMTNPKKVIGFLDVLGDFDPSLLFVLGGAIGVFMPCYFSLIKPRNKPIFGTEFSLTNNTRIDARLIIGAAIFGIGWGLAGICPGPAITLMFVASPILIFITMMFIGFYLANYFQK